ncbi:response regulator [Desulfococcus sp.]|uniref:response regulator n=1 Tax=Desulfococcus sp. TaxID=2025834 RepID=UPI0035937597
MTDRDMASPAIVVVNDDVIQLRILSSMLEQENFTVAAFEAAAEALKWMDPEAPPQLIITDLHMPGIDGWRFCRLLRSMEYAAFNAIPILVVSATFSGEDVRQITARLGADAFLAAPIKSTAFLRQVQYLLNGRFSRIKTQVLIVDPDTTGCQRLKSSFEYGGYYATIAYSGLEAVKCLREHAAEIIILEYQLPDTSGDQLLRELRRIHPQGVFIMITHDPRPELAVGWMQRGAAAYVRKPFDPQYLITLCENACRERALLHVEDILEERTRELLSSEAKYRFIYDNSPVMMHSIDQEGRFCDVNWKWLFEMGYEREAVLGRDAYFMLAPESLDPPDSENIPVFGRQSATDFPCRFRKKNGSVIDVMVSSETVKNLLGKKISICVVRDVTRQKQMENERLHLESQIQKFEGLNLMAGSIAHNFNNLLMGIMGNIEMAAMSLDPGVPPMHNIEAAKKAAERASELSSLMLTYAGKGQITSHTINLARLVEGLISLLEVSITDKADIEFLGRDEPVFIKGDAAQINQAILNIVANAAESLGDRLGKITLSVGTTHCSRGAFQPPFQDDDLPEGVYAFLRITDTGSGMTPETHARAFDPFFTTKFTGRGLGLSTVLGVARGHRGAVSIESAAGRGTSVTLLFPAIEAGRADTRPAPSSPETPGMTLQGTVLLVDDEEIILTIGTEMLKSLGFHVLTARDGLEALRLFQENSREIDLVILDLAMPRLDGEKTFHELLGISPDLKIILSSGYTEDLVAQRFKTVKPDAFIQKPYQLTSLRETITGVLAGDEIP